MCSPPGTHTRHRPCDADRKRRKPALDQIRQAIAADTPNGVALADAGYGNDMAFRSRLTELRLPYVVGVQGSTTVWAPGTEPLPAKSWSGTGRKPKLLRRDEANKPVKISALAESIPAKAWEMVHWREGTKRAGLAVCGVACTSIAPRLLAR